ncbi:hypothetical protein M1N79_04710, partial [Dehalococcoidia bacterium]|nr:hypothetical protein [Dehalococcoidia bacterium]
RDLNLLVTIVSDFLEERFAEIPRRSEIKTFLSQPNKFGWDVKRKLLWLGRHSYLFRNNFRNYVEDRGGKPEIPIIDDFVCQQTTPWAGLGVIDILAETLNISKEQRSTLRSWYERHVAYYRVLAVKDSRIEVLNVINDKPYVIRLPDDTDQFEVGQIIFGSLVPWNEEWYWSGKQYAFNVTTEDTLQELRNSLLRKAPEIAYRYCDQLAKKAKETVSSHYQEFVKYHGDDLVIYPNGISMAADLQKKGRLQWQSMPKEVIAKAMKEHNLQNPWPSIPLPREVLENENGIGMYYNSEEGQEIMIDFNDIINGLKKKGISLTQAETNGIRSFICSDMVSTRFVRRLVREYGYESIELAFLIRDSHEESHLDYLLRRYKGAYYRNRRPRIAFV